jgi:glycine betaine/proline transport system ATP-binding protein
MAAVEFRNVDIIFGEKPEQALGLLDQGMDREEILAETDNVLGVADASICIDEGEICVLMGLSGSGKSTLLRAVNGLNPVTRGEVIVKDDGSDVDVVTCDAKTLRRLRMNRISMVFQQFALLPWRTVHENVGLGLELSGMNKAERDAIVDEKLKLVNLEQWRDKFAHELSGGMQQRVGLARAFATDADILLMDEPFSALDPLIRSHLQDELLELQRSLNKTIIFVSHDLDEALKLGTHIAILEGGRIVQYGVPEQIVLNPANEYVANFVAHMNPLNVLRGGSLMTPLGDLPSDGDTINLDSRGYFQVTLDSNGAPVKASTDGVATNIVPLTFPFDTLNLSEDEFAAVPVDILMRCAVEILNATKAPLMLLDDGKLAGTIGEEEIYRGILR